MGIAFYFASIIKLHKFIVKRIEELENVNNLYLDSNSIIYDALDFSMYESKSQFENYVIQKVVEKIENIIKTINPDKNIIIAFDGVPPLAKLNQQKNRRYKTIYQSQLFNKEIKWDTNCITPGTIFMDKLNSIITSHFTNKYPDKNVILSLTDVPGEGEHKLFEYIRDNDHKNDTTIIYGMDSDLIMLSLQHKKYNGTIYLYRETPHFISNLDSTLDAQHTYVIDINELANQIYYLLTDKTFVEDEIPIENYFNKISDYIFICFLLGNDFNEHFPALNLRHNGLTILLDLYRSEMGQDKNLIKDGKIVWSNFRKYIQKLAENEYDFIKDVYRIREKQEKRRYPENTDEEKEQKFIATPSWERNMEKFINLEEKHWQFRYYYALFDVNVDEDKEAIPRICRNYLDTLQWTYYYYTKGCVNWKHLYKYHYPPLLEDLYKHIPYFNSELEMEEDKTVLHPYALLAYVLPKHSLNLIPNNKIINYLIENYQNNYRDDYDFEYAFCKYFWEGHVKFPHINLDNFTKEISKLI